jgi:hypothetical protein
MTGLVGDEKALYAVSLNAGVWKSVRGGPWRQLPDSPPRACCIAQDPNDPRRLAVGERNGLAADMRLNGSGVWESTDGGETWSYTFDPLCLPGSSSQAIPAIAFSRRATLLIATARGIGRKPAHARTFDFTASPPDIGPVTALAISESRVWARTRERLLVSVDDGRTWQRHSIPATVDDFPIRFGSRGDLFSLAASDSLAILVFRPEPDTTGNKNTLLLYDLAADRWRVQQLPTGNGTGLGGRRYLKSYMLKDPTLKEGIGGRIQLFFGAGQEVHQALGLQEDGTILWDRAAMTDWGGPYPYPTNHIHPDMWDIHVPPSYHPQKDPTAWIACDGGIYQAARPAKPAADYAGRIQQMQWGLRNDGLHTHHIHTLTVLHVHGKRARLAYPTSDNDAWYWDAARGWQYEDYLGDANWTAGDLANPAMALLARRSAGFVMLTTFGDPVPPGANFQENHTFTLNSEERYDGPLAFQCIQTLAGETPEYPLLDAVMLAHLPLKARDTTGKLVPVPGPLGQPNPGDHPVLIRNRKFAADPDVNRSQFVGWSLEADDLPVGAMRFWVSGGHAASTYYVYVAEPERGALYRRDRSGAGWQRLTDRDRDGQRFLPLAGGVYGPAFVNPYHPETLFLLTDVGVEVSRDGGRSFRPDRTLTALLTASGKYPLRTGELTGNSSGVILASRANATGTLAHMAFDRDHPDTVVAASPFTGVFLTEGATEAWRDLSAALPTPLSSVSSVAIDGNAVYVATQGRGLLRIVDYRSAPRAVVFRRPGPESPPGLVTTLTDSAGSVLSDRAVNLRIFTRRGADIYRGAPHTDRQGRLFLPSLRRSDAWRIELRCGGSTMTTILGKREETTIPPSSLECVRLAAALPWERLAALQ